MIIAYFLLHLTSLSLKYLKCGSKFRNACIACGSVIRAATIDWTGRMLLFVSCQEGEMIKEDSVYFIKNGKRNCENRSRCCLPHVHRHIRVSAYPAATAVRPLCLLQTDWFPRLSSFSTFSFILYHRSTAHSLTLQLSVLSSSLALLLCRVPFLPSFQLPSFPPPLCIVSNSFVIFEYIKSTSSRWGMIISK